MKKLIVLLFVCLLMITPIYVYADETEMPTKQEEKEILPTEMYDFNMSQAQIREKLGLPHDEKDNMDIYYQVEYLGVDGHMMFWYTDGKVSGVYWTASPTKTMTEDYTAVKDAIIEYCDEKYGDPIDVGDPEGAILESYNWEDEFNKRIISLYIRKVDGEISIEYSFSKTIELPTIASEEAEDIMSDLFAQLQEQITQ